jgi:hypothetical protein
VGRKPRNSVPRVAGLEGIAGVLKGMRSGHIRIYGDTRERPGSFFVEAFFLAEEKRPPRTQSFQDH